MNLAGSCCMATTTSGLVALIEMRQTTCPMATLAEFVSRGGGAPIGSSWPDMTMAILKPPNTSPALTIV